MGVFACPIDINPLVTQETMARLQKIKDAGYTVVSIWGVSLENYCVTLLALKMNFARTPM
jgi:hypothetical protein